VQPSDGPATPPHTRSRPVHWIGTATALAAVLGLSALVQPPAGAAAPVDGGQHAAVAGGPDPVRARYPMRCGPRLPGQRAVDVLAKGSADFDSDGRTETVALVRCHAGMGTPPSGIFVLAPPDGPDGRPRVVETLLPPGEGMSANRFRVGTRSVSATLLGYSSDDVPRCCPDKRRKVTWDWDGTRFVLTPAPVAQRSI
jgi:hypothetical protein